MCLIFFAYDCHPHYQLIVAANRDEYYSRPALAAGFWADNPHILAGKDLKGGGTWMGITATGRFATLTNYRDPLNYKAQAPSRGNIVQEYLESEDSPEEFLKKLYNKAGDYNGFNLLVGRVDALYYFSNREQLIRKVKKGVHGLSNSLLDVPWPKVTRGIKTLESCLQHDSVKPEHLFEIMADRQQAEDHELPQTGVGLEKERLLSPAFVLSPDYGTRATTVIIVERNNKVRFWERSYLPACLNDWKQVYYEFQLEKPWN
jgi:uncharacterized protein with NRDE domain